MRVHAAMSAANFRRIAFAVRAGGLPRRGCWTCCTVTLTIPSANGVCPVAALQIYGCPNRDRTVGPTTGGLLVPE